MVTGIEVYYKLLKELVNWEEENIAEFINSEEFKEDLRDDSLDLLMYKPFTFEIEDEIEDYYCIRLIFEPRG